METPMFATGWKRYVLCCKRSIPEAMKGALFIMFGSLIGLSVGNLVIDLVAHNSPRGLLVLILGIVGMWATLAFAYVLLIGRNKYQYDQKVFRRIMGFADQKDNNQ